MLTKILENFEKIASVPRCSFHENKIRNFFKSRAEEKGFNYKTDEAWNIVIYVSWTKWRENENPIILQWHMDMVCVKDKDSNHNFEADPIKIIKSWNAITADKTTLWADNGLGLAMAMYLAENENHPPLELLITSSEEVGLIGALNLDSSLLKWKKLINVDTEDLWEICVSSAGWVRIDISKKFDTKKSNYKKSYKIVLWWMKWGHSGVEIDKNRWNAIYSFFEFLSQTNIDLAYLQAGVADNAIPKELEAIVFSDENLDKKLDLLVQNIKENYDAPEIFYKLDKIDYDGEVIENLEELVKAVLNTKVGVIKMSDKIENLVRTSNNLWILNIKDWKLEMAYMPRSSSKEDLEEIKNKIKNNFSWFDIDFSSEYPGWEENPNSEFIKDIKKTYDQVLEKNNLEKAEIVAYHAGLECGALVKKLGETAQAVSVWPTIKGAHTTEESCDLKSVEIVAKVLEEYLKNGK